MMMLLAVERVLAYFIRGGSETEPTGGNRSQGFPCAARVASTERVSPPPQVYTRHFDCRQRRGSIASGCVMQVAGGVSENLTKSFVQYGKVLIELYVCMLAWIHYTPIQVFSKGAAWRTAPIVQLDNNTAR